MDVERTWRMIDHPVEQRTMTTAARRPRLVSAAPFAEIYLQSRVGRSHRTVACNASVDRWVGTRYDGCQSFRRQRTGGYRCKNFRGKGAGPFVRINVGIPFIKLSLKCLEPGQQLRPMLHGHKDGRVPASLNYAASTKYSSPIYYIWPQPAKGSEAGSRAALHGPTPTTELILQQR